MNIRRSVTGDRFPLASAAVLVAAGLALAVAAVIGRPVSASESCFMDEATWQEKYDEMQKLRQENIDAAQRVFRGATGLGAGRIPGYSNGGPLCPTQQTVDMHFKIDPWRRPHRANVMGRQSIEAELRELRSYRDRCRSTWDDPGGPGDDPSPPQSWGPVVTPLESEL